MARRWRGIQPRVRLRPLTRAEQRVVPEKLRDLKVPARAAPSVPDRGGGVARRPAGRWRARMCPESAA